MRIHPSLVIWLCTLTVLSLLSFFLRKTLRKMLNSGRFAWIVILMSAAAFSVWSVYVHMPDGRLHVEVMRGVDSSNVLIRTPRGYSIVVDPRGNMEDLAEQLESRLSPWDYHLDEVLLSAAVSSDQLDLLTEQVGVKQLTLAPAAYRPENAIAALIVPQGIDLQKLQTQQDFEIEPGMTLTLLAETSTSTALVFQFGIYTLLIPNGVDYADLAPALSSSPHNQLVLLLKDEDVAYIPPRVWLQLHPQYVVWMERGISPFVNSIGLDQSPEVNLVSDGRTLWLDD